jgi:hypothetical protein
MESRFASCNPSVNITFEDRLTLYHYVEYVERYETL